MSTPLYLDKSLGPHAHTSRNPHTHSSTHPNLLRSIGPHVHWSTGPQVTCAHAYGQIDLSTGPHIHIPSGPQGPDVHSSKGPQHVLSTCPRVRMSSSWSMEVHCQDSCYSSGGPSYQSSGAHQEPPTGFPR